MKAISLWEPWASAIALGAKRIETRSWSTSYRGPLAIHAAMKWSGDLRALLNQDHWRGALWSLTNNGLWTYDPGSILPFGQIICICDLVDVRPTESFGSEIDVEQGYRYRWTERQMGDFSPGRFAWMLDNIRPLKQPVPFKGRQQLFEIPDHIIQEAL